MMFYRKQKLSRLSQKPFTSMLYVLLCFILRAFFKTVREQLRILLVHPKLLFRGTARKAIMVPENGSYQTQNFAKIFPSLLALTLQIHFLPSFSGITLECVLNGQSSQKCNLWRTRKCTRNYSRNYAFYAISQKLD